MTKSDPIIAVKDVEASANWYVNIFDFKNRHGGSDFAILVDENDDVVLCLHKWDEHDHPTMKNANIPPGNGLILYFRTDNMEAIRENAQKFGAPIEKDVHLSTNSHKKEFSLLDPDGYYLTISEFHNYQG